MLGRSPLEEEGQVDEWRARYREAGFEIVDAAASVDVAGRAVAIDHFPYEADSTGEVRYAHWRPPDRGRSLLHGHMHTGWRQRGRMINAGIDAWGG